MAYPATFDVQAPQEFDKAQVVLRVLILIVLALFGGSIGWIWGIVYLAFPAAAAIMISQKGAERYLAEAEASTTKWLRYLMAVCSYMALATDSIPTKAPEDIVRLDVRPDGTPTVGSALIRLVLAIPHAIVLGLVGIAFAVVWLIAAVSILLNGVYPEWAATFIRGYLRWTARLFVYLASLTDEYPPFSFTNGEATAPAGQAPPSD